MLLSVTVVTSSEEVVQLAPTKAQTNEATGPIDGSRGTWKPFVDKVPKSALNSRRTFLPKTQKAYRPDKKMVEQDKDVARIGRELSKAEDVHASSSFMQTIDEQELKDSKEPSPSKGPVNWPLKKSKAASARWPFGPPVEDTVTLLQDENEDEDKDVNRDSDNSDSDDYDPVQDMLKANGWTADMLSGNHKNVKRHVSTDHQKQHRIQASAARQAEEGLDREDRATDEDEDEDEDKDNDENQEDLGESGSIGEKNESIDDRDTNEGELPDSKDVVDADPEGADMP